MTITVQLTLSVPQAFGALGRRMPSEHYPEYLSAVEPAADGAPDAGEEAEGMEAAPADPPPAAASAAAAPGLASRPGKRKLSTDSSSRG